MLLRNYHNQVFSLFTNQTVVNGLKDPNGALLNSNCPGTSYYKSCLLNTIKTMNMASTFYSDGFLVLGSGNTPASVDDYALESIITTSISMSGVARSIDSEGNFVIVATLQNAGDSQVVINEVGIAARCYTSSSATTLCLVERTVLAEPITLAPGENSFLTYKVKFSPAAGAFPA